MKCLHCGCENEKFLCTNCMTEDILDKIFQEIRFYNPETCENPYLAEYASELTEKYAERDILPSILETFDFEIAEYYYCQYFKMRRDDRLEEYATAYLEKGSLKDRKYQNVLYDLIDSYLPNEFEKPQKWCQMIVEGEQLCCELYAVAAKYYAMIGEYDIADEVTQKALNLCNDSEKATFLFSSLENMIIRLEKQKEDTLRYRTKKPYWPVTEERRRAVAVFYDKKGIKYPRITMKPKKIPESEFAPIQECFEEELDDYCAFWCAEAFSVSAVKSIYEIAAVKVRDGEVTDTYVSYICPWDGAAGRKAAAKEAGVPLKTIEEAEDVDLVLQKFFDFVGEDVLVSTAALGNQSKLLSRAARYAGMREIKNECYDLLDLAADTSEEFDLANNTREYLLSYFSIEEGKNALAKAINNKLLYDKLKEFDN